MRKVETALKNSIQMAKVGAFQTQDQRFGHSSVASAAMGLVLWLNNFSVYFFVR